MFVSTIAGGMCMAMPDVCKTPAPPLPPIPIPYPNMAMCNMAENFSKKVYICSKEGLTLKSKIPQTSGDEAGVAGGIVSGKNMDQAQFKMGSTKVKFEGNPCVRMGAITSHNGVSANAPSGTQIAPSQTKVIVLS